MLGEIWHFFALACTFIVLVARLSTALTFVELIAASIAVGSIIPAGIVYIIACLTSAIG